MKTRPPREIFYVSSQAALEMVRQYCPNVEEFDAMVLSICTPEEAEALKHYKDTKDNMALIAASGAFYMQHMSSVRSAWIMVEAETMGELMENIQERSWVLDREIGNGALSYPRKLQFLADQVWLCHTEDVKKWISSRDKGGPSMTPGYFEERFAATREIKTLNLDQGFFSDNPVLKKVES